jgi:hypothetical protein
VFASSEDARLIERASDLHTPASGAPEDVFYRRTEKGEELNAPLGAGVMDTVRRAPDVITKTFKLANGILGAALLATLLGLAKPLLKALGVRVDVDRALAGILLIAGGWGVVLAFVVGAYSDERALRACAKSWPRMKHYRPKRYKHATAWLRTPLPLAVLVWATVAAAWGSAQLWLTRRTPPDSVPAAWTTAAWVIAGINFVVLVALWFRSREMRRAYRAEYENRREPFNRSTREPEQDERWTSRAKRVARYTVRPR